MKADLQQTSGRCLIAGTITTVLTMILHPSGGSIDHILKIQKVLIISHSFVIFSLPLLSFGFFGLSMSLLTRSKISFLSFTIMAFGLVAAMLAATLNGITLPIFLSTSYKGNIDFVNLVRSYGMAFSTPMAYIFIAMSSMAIFIWSILMIQRSGSPRYVGYYGIIVLASTIMGHLTDLNLISLWGFRLFIFGIVVWNVITGMLMIKGKLISTITF